MEYKGVVKKSRTIDFNIIMLAITSTLAIAESNLGLLQDVLEPKTYSIVAFTVPLLVGVISNIGNIVLRFKTTTAVGEK